MKENNQDEKKKKQWRGRGQWLVNNSTHTVLFIFSRAKVKQENMIYYKISRGHKEKMIQMLTKSTWIETSVKFIDVFNQENRLCDGGDDTF